jgi:hypothetical protein
MKKLVRIISTILAAALFGAPLIYSMGINLPEPLFLIEPSSSALIALALSTILLVTGSGYKGLLFFLLILLANLILLLPLRQLLHDGAVIAASLTLLIIARWIASRPVAPFGKSVVPAVIMALAVLGGWQTLFFLRGGVEVSIDDDHRIQAIMASLLPSAERYREEIEIFLVGLKESEGHGEEGIDKDELVEKLNRRIEELEGERERFERLQDESKEYQEEIALLRQKLKDIDLSGFDEDDFQKVAGYEQAIRPQRPLVRDFSVKLASAYPGSYYEVPTLPFPGEVGIRQVLAIHRYVAGSWKYVNDPVTQVSDFISPADRTIALGLAGDCDDFAVLMASCVEAIGGRARILHGTCSNGAHAWCEVQLGSIRSRDIAARMIRSEAPGRDISWIKPPSGEDYWLSLDWEAGSYSCGNSPRIIYETGGSR